MPLPPARIARSSSRSSKNNSTLPDDGCVAIGDVVGAHGLRGLLRVRVYQSPSPSLAPGQAVVLEHGGARQVAQVTAASPHGRGIVLAAVAGVSDRTAAEALVGARVLVRGTDLPPLEEGEFYHHEVMGFDVATLTGRHLGTIAGTLVTGLNDVWIVRQDEHEHLIPVIADVVRSIDREARRVLIDPLPGLLD